MKKRNNKGFLLAETLIVSSFISISLVYLFIQFRNITTNYGNTLKYDNVNGMYILSNFKSYLEDNNLDLLSSKTLYEKKSFYDLTTCSNEIFTDTSYCNQFIISGDIKKLIYIPENGASLNETISLSFQKYIKSIIVPSSEMYVIAAEFNDGSFSSLKINGYTKKGLKERILYQPIYFTNGVDGLYYYSDGSTISYIFKGTSSNNNINILGNKGKIIGIDDNGVKVLLETITSVPYDTNYSYFTSNSLLNYGSYINASASDSYLFSTLNNMSDSYDYINYDAVFNVGNINTIAGTSLVNIIAEEKNTKYKSTSATGYAATVSVSDLIKASLNSSCNYSNITNDCLSDNWLNDNVWTLNYKTETNVWAINNSEFIDTTVSLSNKKKAYKIIYVKASALALGDGSINNPYIIE